MVVFLGAGIGGAARHGLNTFIVRLVTTDFPIGVMIINVFGSTLMGLLVGYWAFRGATPLLARIFLTTGVLGGFTTFSAFSLDAVLLHQRGDNALALIYIVGSVVLSILGLVAGLRFGRGVL